MIQISSHLEATGETTTRTVQGSREVDHLPHRGVEETHFEWSNTSATLSVATA